MELDAERINQRVRVAQLISRIFMGLAIFMCVCSVVLVMTMYRMGGRLSVISQLLPDIVDGKETISVEVLNDYIGNARSLEWAFVQRFIEEKTFKIADKNEMMRRLSVYGMQASMTSRGVFKPAVNNSDERIKNAEDNRIQHAENIRYVSVLNHRWTVDYDVCEQRPSGPFCNTKRASIAVERWSGYQSWGYDPNLYYNPLGFVVTEYTEHAL